MERVPERHCHRPTPLLDRYEIFRDAIWVTLYSDPGQGTKFPRTLRFPASSVMYLMQQADCLQTRNHPSSRVISFPRTLSDEDVLSMFQEITGEMLTPEDHQALKAEFREFADEFAQTAGITRGEYR